MPYFLYTILFFFFFNDTATTEIYTLSLHDALPISAKNEGACWNVVERALPREDTVSTNCDGRNHDEHDRAAVDGGRPAFLTHDSVSEEGSPVGNAVRSESTRLNSSHLGISYAVFCF